MKLRVVASPVGRDLLAELHRRLEQQPRGLWWRRKRLHWLLDRLFERTFDLDEAAEEQGRKDVRREAEDLMEIVVAVIGKAREEGVR